MEEKYADIRKKFLSFSSNLKEQLKSFDLRGQHYRIRTPKVVALSVGPSLLQSVSKKDQIGVLNKDDLGPFYDR